MLVFSDALIATLQSDANADLPVILWENLVTISNLVADHEDADYPATNLANPATNQAWKSTSTADQYLTLTLAGTDAIDAVGLARHNLGTGGCIVSIEGLTAEPGAVWTELVPEALPGDDAPLLLLCEDAYLIGVRVKLQPDAVAPQAAVLFVGKSLRMERGVQPGLTPFPHGRDREVVIGAAQNGDYLGDIAVRSRIAGTADFRALTASWYRSTMAPFVSACRSPFFFAWMPASQPSEVGYAWCTADPKPVLNYFDPDYLDISLAMEGLAL